MVLNNSKVLFRIFLNKCFSRHSFNERFVKSRAQCEGELASDLTFIDSFNLVYVKLINYLVKSNQIRDSDSVSVVVFRYFCSAQRMCQRW